MFVLFNSVFTKSLSLNIRRLKITLRLILLQPVLAQVGNKHIHLQQAETREKE